MVHIPASLNRAELTVRSGPTELAILENERWASPLSTEIKEAVREELQRRLSSAGENLQSVSKLRLDIDVRRFEASLGQDVKVDAAWSLTVLSSAQEGAEPRTSACEFHDLENIGPGYAGMVQGFQRSTAALADAVVATLSSRQTDGAVSCQPSAGKASSPARG